MKLKNLKISPHSLLRRLSALAGLAFLVPVSASLYYAASLADAYSVRPGETLHISAALPITAVRTGETVSAAHTGCSHNAASLRLFGVFPIKTVGVQQTETVMLIPGGEPFGVRMLMDGCMVIGFGEVAGQDGRCCPALDAGLQEGDIIRETNRTPVTSSGDLRNAASAGEPLLLTVCRDGKTFETSLTPVWSVTDEAFQTGLWVRDSAAGIGTLTYYDPSDGSFAGLGHPICDADTGCRIPLGSGEADRVTISGAIKGTPGAPGQPNPMQGFGCNQGAMPQMPQMPGMQGQANPMQGFGCAQANPAQNAQPAGGGAAAPGGQPSGKGFDPMQAMGMLSRCFNASTSSEFYED